MAKQTLKQQYIIALSRLGYTQDFECRSSKYAKFSHPTQENSYFLGSHGGLRYGRIASDTIGVMDISRKRLQKIASFTENQWQELKQKQADKR